MLAEATYFILVVTRRLRATFGAFRGKVPSLIARGDIWLSALRNL